jgi:hypothetical protein
MHDHTLAPHPTTLKLSTTKIVRDENMLARNRVLGRVISWKLAGSTSPIASYLFQRIQPFLRCRERSYGLTTTR